MSIKRKAGGFRNAWNFTTAIYFTEGGSILPTLIAEEAISTNTNCARCHRGELLQIHPPHDAVL